MCEIHGIMILSLAFVAACEQKATLPLTKKPLTPNGMKRVLLRNIPLGTTIAKAKRFMKKEGFYCTIKRKTSFTVQGITRHKIDFFYCDRSEPTAPSSI